MTTEPKTIYSDLPQNADNNLNHDIDFITKHNKSLAKHTKK